MITGLLIINAFGIFIDFDEIIYCLVVHLSHEVQARMSSFGLAPDL